MFNKHFKNTYGIHICGVEIPQLYMLCLSRPLRGTFGPILGRDMASVQFVLCARVVLVTNRYFTVRTNSGVQDVSCYKWSFISDSETAACLMGNSLVISLWLCVSAQECQRWIQLFLFEIRVPALFLSSSLKWMPGLKASSRALLAACPLLDLVLTGPKPASLPWHNFLCIVLVRVRSLSLLSGNPGDLLGFS